MPRAHTNLPSLQRAHLFAPRRVCRQRRSAASASVMRVRLPTARRREAQRRCEYAVFAGAAAAHAACTFYVAVAAFIAE
jgi:hypothetical protein